MNYGQRWIILADEFLIKPALLLPWDQIKNRWRKCRSIPADFRDRRTLFRTTFCKKPLSIRQRRIRSMLSIPPECAAISGRPTRLENCVRKLPLVGDRNQKIPSECPVLQYLVKYCVKCKKRKVHHRQQALITNYTELT